jgi:hypothetical protein
MTPKLQINPKYSKHAHFPKNTNEPQILIDHLISKETQITNEHKIYIEPQIYKET